MPTQRPLIALLPRIEDRSNGNGQGIVSQLCLTQAVQRAGGTPVVVTPTTDPAELARYVETFDGFLIPGGGDVDPARYGQRRLPECGPVEPGGRDAFECALVPLVVAADKALLGICRGNQVVNVALGGTLWQDLPSQLGTHPEPDGADPHAAARLAREGHIAHSQGDSADLHTHEVAVVAGTRLERIVAASGAYAAGLLSRDGKCEEAVTSGGAKDAATQVLENSLVNSPADPAHLRVNSFHHQAVRDVAPGLVANAFAPDGVVEGLEKPDARFVLSVQWHPESLWWVDPAAFAIFQAFVDAAGGR